MIAEGTRFASVDWERQKITTIVNMEGEKSNNRFNDGKVDPAGRFFAGVKSQLEELWSFGLKLASYVATQKAYNNFDHPTNIPVVTAKSWQNRW